VQGYLAAIHALRMRDNRRISIRTNNVNARRLCKSVCRAELLRLQN
jgi:hypothetical protein